MSNFYISIKDIDGDEVALRPGGVAERELLSEVSRRLQDHGVGWFKSEAKVLVALELALQDALHTIKSDILPKVRSR